jgi:hypothetical protein
MINAAKKLSDEWLLNSRDTVSDEDLFRAAHLNQIGTVILDLQREHDLTRHLGRLVGAWDPFSAERCEAADFFWELQCMHSLRSAGIEVTLQEPPDLVATVEGVEVGIACKKIYSEKSTEKQLSKGVAQAEKVLECGVVAFNIDALYAGQIPMRFESLGHMRRLLDEHNLAFLRTQEDRLRDYMEVGRTVAGYASTGGLAIVPNGEATLNAVRWTTVWNTPALPEPQRRAMDSLKRALTAESG